jgi:hypothetical protein
MPTNMIWNPMRTPDILLVLVLALILTSGPLSLLLISVAAASPGQGNGGVLVTVENEACGNSRCTLVPMNGAVINAEWFDSNGKHSLASQTTGPTGSVVINVPDTAVSLKVVAVFPSLHACPSLIERVRDPTSVTALVLFATNC